MNRDEMIHDLARVVEHLDGGCLKDNRVIYTVRFVSSDPGVISAGLLRGLLAELRRVDGRETLQQEDATMASPTALDRPAVRAETAYGAAKARVEKAATVAEAAQYLYIEVGLRVIQLLAENTGLRACERSAINLQWCTRLAERLRGNPVA